MFDKVDQQLDEWTKGIVGEIEVSFEAPGSDTAGHKIGVYLYEMRQTQQCVGGSSPPPFRLELRYLITSWSQQPKEAHRALAQLMFGALESREFEVDIEPLPASFWNAFKCAPRPCFVLRVPICHEVEKPQSTPVEMPPEIHTTATTALFGRVLGPNRTPLAGATVEVPDLALTTTTSVNGDFRFACVPAEPFPSEILVTAKGREFRRELRTTTPTDEPIIIDVALAELQPAS